MPTALITGASSGIGARYAEVLAALGNSLVLVARDRDRLLARRADLLAAGAPEVEVLVADLTVPADREPVLARLQDPARPVDLLVNNAGLGLGKDFLDCSPDELQYQLDLNVTQVVLLTRAALPGMLARGHGAVVNVASIAGLVPGRGSTYGASKAYLVMFSEGLAMSMRGTGVRIQALCPGFVRTEFHQRAGIDMSTTPDALYVDLDLLVRTSLADLRKDRPVSVPGPLYGSVAVAARLAPRRLVRMIAAKVS
jgi:uncharacterized protein